MNPNKYKQNDNYETPEIAWKELAKYLDKSKIYYDPFYCNGLSGKLLGDLGLNIIHEDTNFYEFASKYEYDIIVTNPPFSDKKKVLEKLFEIGKPFIMIMPINILITKMYKKFIEETSVGIPKSRIQFIKDNIQTNKCSFDCFYYFYKVQTPNKIFGI